MRTLNDIIDAVKSNEETTKEELLYALLTVNALSIFDRQSLEKLAEKDTNPHLFSAGYQFKESWRRWKEAGNKNPKDWLGYNNDPTNPEYQKERKIFKKLADKIVG